MENDITCCADRYNAPGKRESQAEQLPRNQTDGTLSATGGLSATGARGRKQPLFTSGMAQERETRSNADPSTTSESVLIGARSHGDETRADALLGNYLRRNRQHQDSIGSDGTTVLATELPATSLRRNSLRGNRQHQDSIGSDGTIVLAAELPARSRLPCDTRISDDKGLRGQNRKEDSKREERKLLRFLGHKSSALAAGSGFSAARRDSLTAII